MDNPPPNYPPYDHLFRCPLVGCPGPSRTATGALRGFCPHVEQIARDAIKYGQALSVQVEKEYRAHALADLAARQDPTRLGPPPEGTLRAWAGAIPRVPQDSPGYPARAAPWRDRQDPAQIGGPVAEQPERVLDDLGQPHAMRDPGLDQPIEHSEAQDREVAEQRALGAAPGDSDELGHLPELDRAAVDPISPKPSLSLTKLSLNSGQ
jgi:hypothetical protein